jgi:hypothetical protein
MTARSCTICRYPNRARIGRLSPLAPLRTISRGDGVSSLASWAAGLPPTALAAVSATPPDRPTGSRRW